MKKPATIIFSFLMILILCSTSSGLEAKQVLSYKTDTPPVIDGDLKDSCWEAVKPTSIKDEASGAMILLRSVYTDEKVYFSVLIPDKTETTYHKPWIWNKGTEEYETGAHREDTFVFKWNMMEKSVNLSNFSDDSYTADVWYWKANRTNPAGYSDDKHQELSDSPSKKSTELTSTSGKKRFLIRRSDQGKPAYKEFKPEVFSGNLLDRYPQSVPEGSRSDVIAKGQWNGGFWAIEFERMLDTEHNDDVQFEISKKYLFGVSIFSLYGKPHDPNSPNLYGRGRISEPLVLSFQ